MTIPWRRIRIAAYIGLNVGLILWAPERPGTQNTDWQLFLQLREVPPYEAFYAQRFLYHPLMASVFIAVTYLGYWAWFAIHLASVWLLRFSPLLVVLTLTSWGFWLDTMHGNAFVFVFIAGVLALRGSKGWALAYIASCCLMPRPIQVPLALWLLWKMPAIRWPAVVIVAVGIVTALPSLPGWIDAIRDTDALGIGYNLGPSAFLGTAWIIIGIPLAAWLTWRGRVGWAGLAASIYILPAYLLWPLLEVNRSESNPTSPR